jgi:hypothetical protein
MPLQPQNYPGVTPEGALRGPGGPGEVGQPSTLPFGGRNVAALEQASQSLEQAGKDVFEIVQKKQEYANETAAQNATTEYMKGATKLYLQYQGLQGDAARDALPKFQDDLQQLWNQSLAAAPNPQAKRMMEPGTRYYLNRYYSMAEEHASREHQQWLGESAQAAIDEYGNQAVLSMNDPQQMQNMLDLQSRRIASYGEQAGWPPEKIALEQKAQNSKYLVDAIKLRGEGGDIFGAQQLFEQNKDRMSAAAQVTAATYLRPKLKSSTADAGLVQILGEDNAASVGITSPSTMAAGQTLESFKAATMKQESGGQQFRPDGATVTSPKGAIGISQLMPDTAEAEAKIMGIPYDLDRLKKDKDYNQAIGDHLKARLFQKYGGDPTLAAAAYNAGEGAVDSWLKMNGDPRTGRISDAQWTAKIPYAETRNYVLAVGTSMAGQPATPPTAPAGGAKPWPAIEDATRQVLDATRGNPEAQSEWLTKLSRAYSIHNTLTESDRKGMEELMTSSIYSADNGADVSNVITPSVDAMVSVGIPKGRAIALDEEWQVAKSASQIMQGLQFASPADINKARAELEAGTGVFADLFHPHAKGQATTGPGTVDIPEQDETIMYARQKHNIAVRLEQQIANREAMLTGDRADPAQYSMGAANVKKALADLRDASMVTGEDAQYAQGLFARYAAEQKAVQTNMGVPDSLQHILPKESSVKMATELQAPGADMQQKLAEYHKLYGDAFPLVMHDLVTQGKLPAAYQMVDALDNPLDAAQLSKALQEGLNDKKAEKVLGEANVSDKHTGMLALIGQQAALPGAPLSRYLTSLRESGASTDQIDQVVSGIQTLALSKAAIYGVPPTQARNDAISAFIGHYEYLPGAARVPVGSMDATSHNVAYMLHTMSPATIAVPTDYGQPGMPSRQAYIEELRSQPYWITHVTPNGSTALWLLDRHMHVVMGTDGKPFQVPVTTTPMPGSAPVSTAVPVTPPRGPATTGVQSNFGG